MIVAQKVNTRSCNLKVLHKVFQKGVNGIEISRLAKTFKQYILYIATA